VKKNAKNLTFFFKKIDQKNVFFLAILLKKNTIFVNFFEKNVKFFAIF